ncbi:conserved hypothetical protein [Paenibacillus curdlanolyticus YK9]|uniref:Permuted papain-like amidase YaeF/Yiix C92 family enzyme n=1 Tax=Paenibacillus curdlanolyticus YK9 TaxID=717606 RepID=E0IB88_9BACL|nr:hypothetical protein [Paenibacillus curdlanolyticus]EFM10379.1 conserved hypothetical protein [Paenibacillus curdlanolyticus YK9]
MSPKTVTFEELKGELQTGDIFFASGIGAGSQRIEKLEHCEWSHVAMIVRTPDDQLLLWESTSLDNLEDVRFHDQKPGPQLVRLVDRLSTDVSCKYDGKFAIRRLNVDRTPQMLEKLNSFMEQVYEATFPSHLHMYLEVLEGKLGIRTSFQDFFCSKLLAETYIQLGLLPDHPVANSYEPASFTSSHHLPLLLHATLDDEVLIDIASIPVS